MADDTFESRGINSVVWAGKPKIREFRANGTDIKPGLIVTTSSETFPDIDLVAAGEVPIGVVLERYDVDIDTAYDDDDEHVPVALISENPGLGVYVFKTANAGDTDFHTVFVTDDNGMIKPFSYTDGAVATDTMITKIGKGAEHLADDASNAKLTKIFLGA